MRRARAAGLGAAVVLGLAVAALGACGDEDDGPAAPAPSSTSAGGIELSIRYDDGSGREQRAILTCREGEQRAGGFLRGKGAVSELCGTARSLAALLTTQPDTKRACTQIYGGAQTAHVTGTIEGAKVDRRFSRTNGCEIADFTRAAALLQP